MEFLKDILKGAVIGVANAIPGVSGGTMMVSMGVYDNIIYCITHLFKQFKKSLLKYLIILYEFVFLSKFISFEEPTTPKSPSFVNRNHTISD